jgi:hypothetical protein
MQPQTQKKVVRADRIEGSIDLYRSAARSQFNAQKPLSRVEPWWNVVFAVPFFLRTVLRLVFVCHHWHGLSYGRGKSDTPGNVRSCKWSAVETDVCVVCTARMEIRTRIDLKHTKPAMDLNMREGNH